MTGRTLLDGLETPPQDPDPKAQLQYLCQVVEGFAASQHPRLRPIKRKLYAALKRLTTDGPTGDPKFLAERFAQDVIALRIETYELLHVVVNQSRASLRLLSSERQQTPARVSIDDLQAGFDLFSQGLRKAITALRQSDTAQEHEANTLMQRAQERLQKAGLKA